MLPWEQAPKQVAIMHTLTWTGAGGTTSPSDPLMGEEISSRFVCAQSAAVRRMLPKQIKLRAQMSALIIPCLLLQTIWRCGQHR